MSGSANGTLDDANKRKSDFAWSYATQVSGKSRGTVKCMFCDQTMQGGINRIKNHLGGTHKDSKPCQKVPHEIKERCKKALEIFQNEKTRKEEMTRNIGLARSQQDLIDVGEEEGFGVQGSCSVTRPPRACGPLDQFVSIESNPSIVNSKIKKEERNNVCDAIGRFIYANALPFNLVNSPYWKEMLRVVGNFGPGLKGPSMHELRTSILKKQVNNTEKMMSIHKKSWATYGCSIMSDGWTDGKNRSIINFLVSSPAGTMFLKSIDASDQVKSGTFLFECLDKVVEEVGEDNVVQVITDNAASYVSAGKQLMEKRKRLFWTPCAAHCIDLMLEEIGKMKVHEDTIRKAKDVTNFIYAHGWVLNLMRKFTKGRELLRPAVTRFATSYLTLQSLYREEHLISLFSSEEYTSSSWAKKPNAIKARAIILFDPSFWSLVGFCVRTAVPLVSVLREVDSDERPSMGFLYEAMDSAKERIADACGKVERKYLPFWRIIDRRWTNQLHSPLHAAGYYLNPRYFYSDNFNADKEVKEGLYACMRRMLIAEERDDVDIQLDDYKNRTGSFGLDGALTTMKRRTPVSWWERFGEGTPELMKFAIRILSLTCSASGCERNWSTFEQVHTKRRNRLEHKRLNSFVFVMYNMKLNERTHRRRQLKKDPLFVEEPESDDEWIAEQEDPCLSKDLSWLDKRLEDDDEHLEYTAINLIPETEEADDTTPTSKRQKTRGGGDASTSKGTIANEDDQGTEGMGEEFLDDVDISDEALE